MQPMQLPDPASLSAAATGISSSLAQFDSVITELTRDWSSVAGSYSAHEDEVVVNAFSRLSPMCDDLVTLAGGFVGGVIGGVVGGEIGTGIGEWAMGLFGGDE